MSKRRAEKDIRDDDEMEEEIELPKRVRASQNRDGKRSGEHETSSEDIQEHRGKRNRFFAHTGNSIFVPATITVEDDRPPGIPNIMSFSPQQRKEWMRQSPNKYGWPLEYLDIYNREKFMTDPKGFQGTERVDGVKLFTGLGDPTRASYVENNKNKNCIKSRHLDTGNEVFFDKSILDMFKKQGIYYIQDDGSEDGEDEDEEDVSEEIKSQRNYVSYYEMIILTIRHFLGDYAQFVCIAGGFSLSKYLFDNYEQEIPFGDIDLFIHSCDEKTANEIIAILGVITGKILGIERGRIFENDNVLCSFFNDANNPFIEDNIISFTGHKSIQIIKRLYTCPAQIILGFDVDCCCILTTMDGETYASERCCYAIRNAYNVLNFDRMSPSYEYRLGKYNKRGFAIWVPFMEHFKANAVFDRNDFDFKKGSTIFLQHLIADDFKGIRINKETSDYFGTGFNKGKYYNPEVPVTFKTLNPGEQIINTFHRIVLEDPIEWYPIRGPDVVDNIQVNQHSMNVVEVLNGQLIQRIKSMNIIRKYKTADISNQRVAFVCHKIIEKINKILPGSLLTGNIVRGAISGIYGRVVEVYNPALVDTKITNNLKYVLNQFVGLLYVRNSLAGVIPGIESVDISELGRIIFRDSRVTNEKIILNKEVEDKSAVSEEENFENFLKYINDHSSKMASFCGRINDFNEHSTDYEYYHEASEKSSSRFPGGFQPYQSFQPQQFPIKFSPQFPPQQYPGQFVPLVGVQQHTGLFGMGPQVPLFQPTQISDQIVRHHQFGDRLVSQEEIDRNPYLKEFVQGPQFGSSAPFQPPQPFAMMTESPPQSPRRHEKSEMEDDYPISSSPRYKDSPSPQPPRRMQRDIDTFEEVRSEKQIRDQRLRAFQFIVTDHEDYFNTFFRNVNNCSKLNIFYPSPDLSVAIDTYVNSDNFIAKFYPNITGGAEFRMLASENKHILLAKMCSKSFDDRKFLPVFGKRNLPFDVIYDLFDESTKIEINKQTKFLCEMGNEGRYDEMINLLYITRVSPFSENENLALISEEEKVKRITTRITYENKAFNTEMINKTLIRIHFIRGLIENDFNFKKFMFIYKFLFTIKTDVVVYTNSVIEHDTRKDIYSENGRFFGTEYDLALLSIGASNKEVSEGIVKILPYSACENYIPC